MPTAGNTDLYQSASLDLELSRRRYAWSRSLQVQISLSFKGAFIADRLLSIEGTSMAAPVVAGALALMLQRDPALTTARARGILAERARHDAHTGPAPWTPGYG